jgi:hypothetical protein
MQVLLVLVAAVRMLMTVTMMMVVMPMMIVMMMMMTAMTMMTVMKMLMLLAPLVMMRQPPPPLPPHSRPIQGPLSPGEPHGQISCVSDQSPVLVLLVLWMTLMMMTTVIVLTVRLVSMKMMLLAPLVMLRLSASLWVVQMMNHCAFSAPSSALGRGDSGRPGTPRSGSCGCAC